jgi:hypothetical protein
MRHFVLCLLALSGCGGSTVLREPDEYVGCGTDEHWRTFDDQERNSVIADVTGPAITAPDLTMTQPQTPKPIFTWNQDPNDAGDDLGDVPHADGPGCNECCPEWNMGALSSTHLPQVSGNVYDLQFSSGGSVVHRVVTTLQEWTATDSVWSSWKNKSLSLRIYRMDLLSNDVRPGVGGPFTAVNPFPFKVGP